MRSRRGTGATAPKRSASDRRARRRRPGHRRCRLRRFLADELGAKTQIKQNPTRAGRQPIGPMPCKEPHPVECLFRRIERFRRIAPRRDKTVTPSQAFVALACPRARLT